MDDSKLSIEQLSALSRAVPEDSERKDLALFLKVIDRWSTCMHLPWTRCAPIWLCSTHNLFTLLVDTCKDRDAKIGNFPKTCQQCMHSRCPILAAND